jgi:hypothetical protein
MTAPFGLFRLLTPALSPASPEPEARHRGAPEKKRGGLGNDMMSRRLSSATKHISIAQRIRVKMRRVSHAGSATDLYKPRTSWSSKTRVGYEGK